jgi:hypothetical protein
MTSAAQDLNGGIMKAIKLLGISVVAVGLTGSTAFAKVTESSKAAATSGVVTPLPSERTVADNVVVTPSGQTAPAAQPVQPAQPVQVQPVEQVPVAPQRTYVTEDKPHNYMATIAVSALMGAVAGVLIGGAIYYIDTPREHAERIGYWAAGGVLVGTGVGLINVITDESRADRAAGAQLPTDPVPTFRLSLLQTRF